MPFTPMLDLATGVPAYRQIIDQILGAIASGAETEPDVAISGVCGAVLLILSVWLLVEAVRILSRRNDGAPAQRAGRPGL